MRQFNFFYTSYLKNNHGFINMMPHAKIFHPYLGMGPEYGETIWRTKNDPLYATSFINEFKRKTWTFEHKIKIFFPEIRTGLLMISDIKYSSDFNEDDKVTVEHEVLKGDNYNEYIEINDFIAEIDINIYVKFGRNGLSFPGRIDCKYIDLYLFDQKISLITHLNNLLFAPYYMPYQTEFPFELARSDVDYSNITSNTERKYGFIIPIETKDLFESINIKTSKVNTDLLDVDAYRDQIRDTHEFDSNASDEIATLLARKQEKYKVILPMSIFPNLGYVEMSKMPIFDSEKCMPCCLYWKAGGGNMLATSLYNLHSPTFPGQNPAPCPQDDKCVKEPQYETRNKLVNTVIRLADMTWEFLDDRAVIVRQTERMSRKKTLIKSDEFDNKEEL